jgi:hypothetical protein
MRDQTIEALEQEINLLNSKWQIAMEQAIELVKRYEGRQVSTHLGHNLANAATELSEIAAKVEQTHSVLAYVRGLS